MSSISKKITAEYHAAQDEWWDAGCRVPSPDVGEIIDRHIGPLEAAARAALVKLDQYSKWAGEKRLGLDDEVADNLRAELEDSDD